MSDLKHHLETFELPFETRWKTGIFELLICSSFHLQLVSKHFFHSYTDGAFGAAAGAAAASAAASAVCIYYVIWGRFAPPYKYMIKYIQQQQHQQQLPQQL